MRRWLWLTLLALGCDSSLHLCQMDLSDSRRNEQTMHEQLLQCDARREQLKQLLRPTPDTCACPEATYEFPKCDHCQ